jgi:hypothetical protein
MFVRLRNWVADSAAGIKIRADYHDLEDDGFADGLSQCIVKDGQTTIMQNIPFNGKRIVAMADPLELQDAATKAYADLKLSLTGGTITGNLDVTGTVGALGYKTRPGVSGTFGANLFNFNWASSLLEAWIDNTKVGDLATQDYTNTTANAAAAAAAAPKVNRAGDTMTGGLTVNGELVAAQNYLRFGYSGGPGYIIWNGGASYSLGGAGAIWHATNLGTPVTNGRWINMGAVGAPGNDRWLEANPGVITGLLWVNGYLSYANFRYLQLLTPAGWVTVGYA